MFARIYPGIGLGRFGNSPNEIFVGPEAPLQPRSREDPYNPDGQPFSYKDAQGRLKRQAARFRVYLYAASERGKGYEAVPERELTLGDSDVDSLQWTVTLANKKASHFEYIIYNGTTTKRRNNHIADRSSLEIRPSPVSVSGRSVNKHGGEKSLQFDDGKFCGRPVNLGELRTDEEGRLLACGGYGHADFVDGGKPIRLDPFNNDYWYDDASDGPVECTIRFSDGSVLEAERASVLFTPPKFAPRQLPSTTFYDIIKEISQVEGFLPGRDMGCDYYRDVHPILSTAIQHAWLSADSLTGHKKHLATLEIPLDADNIEAAARADNDLLPASIFESSLGLTPEENAYIAHQVKELCEDDTRRQLIMRRMRKPEALSTTEERKIQSSRYFMPLPANRFSQITATQYLKMKMWADGDFTLGDPPKFGSKHADPESASHIPLAEQPGALDRAAMEHTAGHALNPGVEFGKRMTHSGIYKAAFRLNEQRMGPGDITSGLALPWQADFHACWMNWWPTTRPEQVIPESAYEKVGASADGNALERVGWDRGINDMQDIVTDDGWAKLGMVTPKPGRNGFTVYVETERDMNLPEEPAEGGHPELPYLNDLRTVRNNSAL